MANNRVILARRPGSIGGVAVGPFKSARGEQAARRELDAMGWDYHDTVTLISGSDLKHLAPRKETTDGT
jgi:hypothetical protein